MPCCEHAVARGLRGIAVALFVLLFTACSALPTDVQRTPSYALDDTSDSELVRNLEPL